MIEVRFHGRGGQGVVTCAELLSFAAIHEGKYAQSFPSFGPERRGAPVVAFLRIDDKPIYLRSQIYNPDIVVVLDPTILLLPEVKDGLKKGGRLIVNTKKSLKEIKERLKIDVKLATVNATKIALDNLGLPITNTTMLGSVVKVTGLVKIHSLKEALIHRFPTVYEKNFNAMTKAYKSTNFEK
jgi:pyruvate ferredoxin oxidoreductase gamma subunit